MEPETILKNEASPKSHTSRINLFALLFATLFFISCGAPKEKEVTVSNVDISGTIKDFVKVVGGSYKFTNDGKKAFITIQFELVSQPNQALCRKKHPEEIRINPIDVNGNVFNTGVYGFSASRTEMSKLKDLLNKGKVGDKKRISFEWTYFGQDKELGSSIFKKAGTFEVIDETFDFCGNLSASDLHWDDVGSGGSQNSSEYVEMNDEPDESEIEAATTSSHSNDIDEMLISYEKYVDQYLKYVKKIKDGDLSAMTEYTSFLKRSTDLGEKMEKVKGNFSSAQLKKYLEINNKFTTAIVDMTK